MSTVEDKTWSLASRSASHLEEMEMSLETLLDLLPNKDSPLAIKLEAFRIAVKSAKNVSLDILHVILV